MKFLLGGAHLHSYAAVVLTIVVVGLLVGITNPGLVSPVGGP